MLPDTLEEALAEQKKDHRTHPSVPEGLQDRRGFIQVISESPRDALGTVLGLVDPVQIAQRIRFDPNARGKYCPTAHAELCRFKMIGLSTANACKAVGIHRTTLDSWLDVHPALRTDLSKAEQLANAEVAKLLFGCMSEGGPVGLNAIKFFLSTHAEEFRERQILELQSAEDPDIIKKITQELYGLNDGSTENIPVPE